MSELVTTEQNGTVLEMILNRPERLNAMTIELFNDLEKAIAKAQQPEIRCVLMRGAGKVFSVGGDIQEFAKYAKNGEIVPTSAPDHFHKIIQDIRALPKPVIVVAHGSCAGAGISLLLSGDLAIAAEATKFNLAYVGIGVSPDGGSTFFLPKHVGMKKAMEIFLLGQVMTAQEVCDLGLINRVVANDQVLEYGREIAQKLSMGPTAAFAKLKTMVNKSYENTLSEQLDLESQYFSQSTATEDFRIGIEAFLAKKAPLFKGC